MKNIIDNRLPGLPDFVLFELFFVTLNCSISRRISSMLIADVS
jgi:hypothetical protein